MPTPRTKKKRQQKAAVDPMWMAQRAQIALGSGADFEARRIYLVGEITSEATFRFMPTFQIMDETPGPITVVLSSPGGSEPDGYAIYDAIRHANNKVLLLGYGAVQSIAALIFQAGDKRLVTPGCRFMIHNGSIELGGGVDANTLVAIGREVESNNLTYHRILAERAGLELQQVRQLCQDESYFNARETVRHGFADGIMMPDGSIEEGGQE